MKKFGAKQICLGVIAVGVLLCFVVYLTVYMKYTEETEALEASNAQLEMEVNDLKQYYDNMELYKKNIAQMKETIAQVTADYPGDAREEDVIMMAVNMHGVTLVNFEKINIDGNKVIHSIPKDVVKGLNDETLQTDINFRQRQASYSCLTDYTGLKELIAEVFRDEYRVGINSIAFKNEDEDNNFIKGTIDISYYNLTGMNKEYTKPAMPTYEAGTMDLFPATIVDGERVIFGLEDAE